MHSAHHANCYIKGCSHGNLGCPPYSEEERSKYQEPSSNSICPQTNLSSRKIHGSSWPNSGGRRNRTPNQQKVRNSIENELAIRRCRGIAVEINGVPILVMEQIHFACQTTAGRHSTGASPVDEIVKSHQENFRSIAVCRSEAVRPAPPTQRRPQLASATERRSFFLCGDVSG